MISLGLDVACGKTGVVLLGSSVTKFPDLLLESVIHGKGTGMARVRQIVTEIMEIVHKHKPDRIVIEGYSLSMKNAGSVVPLIEVGGILRFMLHLDGLKWLDPRAGELKKFVTGSGGSAKSTMMMHVLKRWGHESLDDNTADAYGCACIGLAHANKLPGATLEQRKVVGGLKILTQ